MNVETGSMRHNAFGLFTVIICMALMIGCASTSTSKGMVPIEKMEQLTLGMHVKEIRTLLGSPATIKHRTGQEAELSYIFYDESQTELLPYKLIVSRETFRLKSWVPDEGGTQEDEETSINWSEGLGEALGEALVGMLGAISQSVESGGASGTPPKQASGNAVASAPNDLDLRRQMAGSYFSFSGGGYGSSGGTARGLTLCPDGTFSRSSESSYSGDLSGGGSWGAASQGGSDGKWIISGNKLRGTITLFSRDGSRHSFNFEDCSHEIGGCFYFDGIKYGWGAPNCQYYQL
jgi:hypothetical protein